jgi:hypothetical protein
MLCPQIKNPTNVGLDVVSFYFIDQETVDCFMSHKMFGVFPDGEEVDP